MSATNADVTANEQAYQEPGYKVFAGNLTYATDEAALKNFFAPFADDILSAQIIFHGNRSTGYGFVTFKTDATVDRAVAQLDKQELDGRPVIVERAKPSDQKRTERAERRSKRRFGGRRGSKGVPGEATEPKEGEEAQPAVNGDGTAADATQKPKKKKAPRKKKVPKTDAPEGVNGVAEQAAPAAAEGATAGEPRARRPKKPRSPKEPRERRPRGEQPAGDPSTSVLFVANLAFSVDEPQLNDFFVANGVTPKSVRVVRWKWGTPRKSKGYAFVDVGTEDEQKKAIDAVNGKTLAEREVTVRVAVNANFRDAEEGAAAEGGPAAAPQPIAAAA